MFLFLLACHHNIGFEQKTKESTKAWKELLIDVTINDDIDYQMLQENQDILEDYLGWVGDNGPRMNRIKGTRGQKKGREDRRITHYANAYNAWVLYEILSIYPIETTENLTLDQFHLFENAYQVDGEYMTLHHLKEERLLGTYQEPLLHMMLHDGSKSSPQLQYWETEQLQYILRRKFHQYLNSEYGAKRTKKNEYNEEENEEWLFSELFKRAEDDFIYWSKSNSLCQYLSEYAEEELQVWLAKQEQQGCSLTFQSWNYELNTQNFE